MAAIKSAVSSAADSVVRAVAGLGSAIAALPDDIAEGIGKGFGLDGIDTGQDIAIPTVAAGDKYESDDFELMRSCPAPLVLNLSLAGQQTFTFQYVCEFAASLRPLILASAYMSAFYIVFVYRED
ncbi:MAG: hypothetical protein KA757_06150 [Vogesella sp.]|nr:hypothetical protein [Vogesella sp.]